MRRTPARFGKAVVGILLSGVPLTAHAGMSMPTFTDIAQARLRVISFFLVGYFLLAWIYQRLWNSLGRDFPKLPRLSYRGSLAALAVCGLFIYVVLTMISGARELMTPGAWERTGTMYHVREPAHDPKPWLDAARRASLETLRGKLWSYAQEHGDSFPASSEDAELPPDLWRSIDPNGLPLIYLPGSKSDAGRDILVYEPATFGQERFVLLSSGEIVQMQTEEITRRVQAQITQIDEALAKKNRP